MTDARRGAFFGHSWSASADLTASSAPECRSTPPSWLMREEDRVPVLRALVGIPALDGAVGGGRPAPVDRARRRRGRGGCRRRVLPRPPLRSAARLPVPAAGGGRGPDQPDRTGHRRDRHALREPALHGRGRRRRRSHLRWPAAARHQPGITRAGRSTASATSGTSRRGHERRRHGPRAHQGVPRGPQGRGLRPAQPAPDVRRTRRACCGSSRTRRVCGTGSGGAPARARPRSGRPSRV